MGLVPIKIYFLYIAFTLCLSFWGPMKYYDYDKFSVFIYIAFFILCLILGCLLANTKNFVIRKTKYINDNREKNINKILLFLSISITIGIASIFLEFLEMWQKNMIHFSFTGMAKNYLHVAENTNGSYSIIILIRFFTGFFKNVSLILGFYYWNILNSKEKLKLKLMVGLIFIVNMIGYGTQKFLGDIIIYMSIVLGIKMLDMEKKKIKKLIIIIGVVLIFSLLSFSFVQAQRYDLIGVTPDNYQSRSDGRAYIDSSNIIFLVFGEKFGLGLAMLLTGYLSAGYYGLSLCLKLPFEWTYGIGSSYFLSKLTSRIFGIEIYEKTYLNRMTEYYGRNGLKSWNTIFPWIASDFTFVGSLLLFIIVGYVWQKSWLEIVKYRNPVSIVMFSTITLGFIFVPANNQLFHGIDTFISTLFIILFWIFFHKKFNKYN